VGAFLGWKGVLITIFVGCLSGSVVGIALIGLRWLRRREHIPFGPFLAFGATMALFWGERLIDLYSRFLR
jgi:leader peptidase (prepilin peptidase)/N-methyltransferase